MDQGGRRGVSAPASLSERDAQEEEEEKEEEILVEWVGTERPTTVPQGPLFFKVLVYTDWTRIYNLWGLPAREGGKERQALVVYTFSSPCNLLSRL